MRKKNVYLTFLSLPLLFVSLSCDKNSPGEDEDVCTVNNINAPCYNLNVLLRGKGSIGFIKFRQDPDPAKIITLDIKVENMQPNHEYLLQRAVDPINVVDGNCTSTAWLTLGKGLNPQSILTSAHGKGSAELWRDVSAVPSGSTFDIHFQVIDAVSLAVVLTSDCLQYQVR
jgi:hypothetical protein